MSNSTALSVRFKTCPDCGLSLPATPTFFYRNSRRKDNCQTRCKRCQSEYMKHYQARYIETIREREKRERRTCIRCGEEKPVTAEYWYRHYASPDGFSQPCKACRREDNWGKRNPERKRELERKWYHEGRGKATRQRYIASGRAAANTRRRRRTKEGRAKKREYDARRRARKAGAEGEYTMADVRRAYKAQRGKCWWCGEECGESYHVDHLVPLSRGGSNSSDNLVISCPACNCSKNDKLPYEWCGRLL